MLMQIFSYYFNLLTGFPLIKILLGECFNYERCYEEHYKCLLFLLESN